MFKKRRNLKKVHILRSLNVIQYAGVPEGHRGQTILSSISVRSKKGKKEKPTTSNHVR